MAWYFLDLIASLIPSGIFGIYIGGVCFLMVSIKCMMYILYSNFRSLIHTCLS